MMGMARLVTVSLAFSILLPAADLPEAKQWPQFRGPGSTGVADDPALPDKWSATENVAWKTAIPGVGWSSPIIWGDRIFVTTVIASADVEKPKKGLYFGGERKAPTDEHRWMVYAVDFATGKIVWEREVKHGVPSVSRHLKNSYASETPVTDGQRVYAYFGNVGPVLLRFFGQAAVVADGQARRHAVRMGHRGVPDSG